MFDLSNAKEFEGGGGVLSPGQYTATIESAEVTRSKANNKMIKIVFAIENGPKLFDYVNLEGDKTAMAIGLSRAKSILLATGYQNLNFRNEMEMARAMRGSLVLTLGVKDYTDQKTGEQKKKNEIKKYSAMVGGYKVSKSNSNYDDSPIPF
jgi:hypothetical protein